MRTIILVDGQPLMWRAAYSKGEYYITEGVVTYFFDIVNAFDATEVLLFWDEGASRWRSEFYPEYKANRADRKKEFDLNEMKRQKDEARKHLANLGVRDFSVYGVEADDLISWFSEYFSKVLDYDRVIIATRDHDFWQLINDKISVYDPLNKVWVDKGFVENSLGILPPSVVDWKALVGDTADNIKGVKGVGEKTALALIKEYGGVGKLLSLASVSALKKKKTTSRILDFCEDLESCYRLVRLPGLHEVSGYLNAKEKHELVGHITKDVNPDALKVQVESDLMGNQYRISRRYLSPLTEIVKGILPWLGERPLEDVSSLSELDVSIGRCNRCPLRSESSPILPTGYSSADIVVVTDKTNSDLEKSNELIDKTLLNLTISFTRVWRTHLCKCGSKSDRPVTYGEMSTCVSILLKEIDLLKPKLIILMGTEALSVLNFESSGQAGYGLDALTWKASQYSGDILPFNGSHAAILPSPLAALRSKARMTDWDYGVSKIKDFLERG